MTAENPTATKNATIILGQFVPAKTNCVSAQQNGSGSRKNDSEFHQNHSGSHQDGPGLYQNHSGSHHKCLKSR